MELVREAVGDDFHILCDGNKAPGDADANGEDPTLWNFKRAYDTAMEYQRLNVYWFEEPLPRYDYKQLAELNRLLAMPMAGGERIGASMSSGGFLSRAVSTSSCRK